MIIFRYISKEVLVSAFALTFIIFFISLTGRFVNLLADAAAGKYSVDVLFVMIGYHMPGLLQIILPVSFYIAILLSFGRLYTESEMVVLFACGMSEKQLLAVTLIPAFAIASVVGLFSFWLTPLGEQLNAKIVEEQLNRSEFETINAGYFQPLGQRQITVYVDELINDHKSLQHVFISRAATESSPPTIALAESGEQIRSKEYGQRYLVLHNGDRYEGKPGSTDFQVTHFSSYGQYIADPVESGDYTSETDAKSTSELLSSNDRSLRTALQWRLALPLMVFIGTVLAIPLSRTNSRQGRFLKLFPALIIFFLYYTFLGGVSSAMNTGKWPILPGLWVVHLAFAGLAFVLFNWDGFRLRHRKIRQGK